MNVNASIWDRLTLVVASLSAVAALVWVAVLYFPLMHQNEVMRQQIAQLNRQIREEEAVNRQVRLEIDSLKTDPKTVERLARGEPREAAARRGGLQRGRGASPRAAAPRRGHEVPNSMNP